MEQPHKKPLLPVLDRGKGWPTNDFVCEKWIGLEIHEAGGSRRMPNKRESESATETECYVERPKPKHLRKIKTHQFLKL